MIYLIKTKLSIPSKQIKFIKKQTKIFLHLNCFLFQSTKYFLSSSKSLPVVSIFLTTTLSCGGERFISSLPCLKMIK